MIKKITLFAILVFGIQFCNASIALPLKPIINEVIIDVENNDVEEDRFYFWKVENAHGVASGYSLTLEKAKEMIKKVSEGDKSRSVIIMSNPR
ncbi:hypothetical protein SCB49_11307 [unidentified eubacterium SCB49]|nr:hypothetical protein SCB49_11307 [unidentified eubacterium SCB49]